MLRKDDKIMASKKYDVIGEERFNNFGSKMKIIDCRGHTDIDIYFEEYNYIVKHKRYERFKNGSIECPYEPRHCGIGYIGEGKYSHKTHKKIYNEWIHMLKRCYSEKVKNKYPTYIGCSVDKEWHNFQNFAKWYEENYYEIKGQRMELDKDILYKGNKIYSSSNCIFVPQRINSLLINCKSTRGDLPIGVTYHNNKFYVRCSILDGNKRKRVSLGYYNTIEEAFQTYKNFKEKYIKEIAEEYKGLIPNRLYRALYEYKIEIND